MTDRVAFCYSCGHLREKCDCDEFVPAEIDCSLCEGLGYINASSPGVDEISECPDCQETGYMRNPQHECEWGTQPHLRVKVDEATGEFNYPCLKCGHLNHVKGAQPMPGYWIYGSHADFCSNCGFYATPHCLV